MSVSIVYQPKQYSPVYNDLVYIVDSTNKTKCSMQYVFHLYIEGNFIKEFTSFPNEEGGLCSFNLSNILRNYVGDDINQPLFSGEYMKGLRRSSNGILGYQVQFGEYTDGTTGCTGGTFVTVLGLTSQARYTWNGAMDYEEFHDYDQNDYVGSTGPNKWLTDQPEVVVSPGETAWLTCLQNEGATYSHARISTTSLTGATADFYLASQYYPLNPGYGSNRKISIGCGPLNLITNGYVPWREGIFGPTTSKLIVNSNVDYYDVDLITAGPSTLLAYHAYSVDGAACSLGGGPTGSGVLLHIVGEYEFAPGTTFSYSVSGLGPIGASGSGTGTILACTGGYIYTDVTCTTPSGVIASGSIGAVGPAPGVGSDPQFDNPGVWDGPTFGGAGMTVSGGSLIYSNSGGTGGALRQLENIGATVQPNSYYKVTYEVITNDFSVPGFSLFQVNLQGGTTIPGNGTITLGGPGTYSTTVRSGNGYQLNPMILRLGNPGATGAHTIEIGSLVIEEITPNGGCHTEKKRFHYNQYPTRFETFRILWDNQLGGVDSTSFRLVKTASSTSKRTEYTRPLGSMTDQTPTGATVWQYKLGDRGRTVVNSDVTEKFQVLSERVTSEQADWLKGLFETNSAYLVSVAPQYCIYNTSLSSGLKVYLRDNDPSFLPGATVTVDWTTGSTAAWHQSLVVTAGATTSTYQVLSLSGPSGPGPTGASFPITGTLSDADYIAKLTPIIITSNWKNEGEKRAGGKNVYYTIEFEKAVDKITKTG